MAEEAELPGEFVVVKLPSDDCALLFPGNIHCPADLTMSNHRIWLRPSKPVIRPISLPLMFVESAEKVMGNCVMLFCGVSRFERSSSPYAHFVAMPLYLKPAV